MTGAPKLMITLVAAWVVGVLATRWILLHAFAIDAATLTLMAAVPLTQAACFLAWRAVFRRRR